jgi:HPt (histidine-containing phosphotransfer) domain-containing protein
MQTPLNVPGVGPLDLDHLRRMTLGDAGLEHEVLGMFTRQANHLAATLAALPPETNTLVHTLKGSARAVGAVRVAAAAESLEFAIRDRRAPDRALADLRDAVAEANAAIAAILGPS